jgi:hypothetical protein
VKLRRLLLAWLLLPLAAGAQEELGIGDLGDLDLAWTTVEDLDRVPGPPLSAVAVSDPGATFRMRLPAEVQRADFQVPPGASVAAGQAVALLEGLEIHHWQLEFESLETRFETARSRYERNLPLYREGALPGDRWAEIEERFFALRLEFEHMRHVREWLRPGPETSPESLLVTAPVAGVVLYDSRETVLGTGATLFEILPEGGLRLRAEVPAGRAQRLAALTFDDCEVAIDRVEEAAHGFYRSAWSDALAGSCAVAPGTALGATPLYREQALFVPREAVFQWRQAPHVWLRQGDRLVARQVELIADVTGGYAVSADPDLEGGEVLIRSVSAAQGLLLGLGGD